MICTFAACAASSACPIIARSFASESFSGKRKVSITPIGSAPALARSLSVIWIARCPISFAVPVIGSVDKTNISSSCSATAAQSSPTEAPNSTSGRSVRICFNTDLFNTASGTLPTFILIRILFISGLLVCLFFRLLRRFLFGIIFGIILLRFLRL